MPNGSRLLARIRAGVQKRLRDLSAGLDQMLTIIEDEQQSFRAQSLYQSFQRAAIAALA
jgi:hypothetical protein